MFPCVDGRGSSSSTSTASVLTTGVDTVWDLLFSASKYQYITDQMPTKPRHLSESRVASKSALVLSGTRT